MSFVKAHTPLGARDVTFTVDYDGTAQKYVLVLPGEYGASGAHDLLVALHGHGADRWQFIKDKRDECRAVRDFAVKRGMILVSPDYRAPASWMGPAAEADTRQIIEELKTGYRIRRVFLCGGSMGGTASLTFAALHPELIDGVASMNGHANFLEYENFQSAIAESFGGDKSQVPREYRMRSAGLRPERLVMPVGLTLSGGDKSVPPGSGLKLAEDLRGLSRKVKVIYRAKLGHVTEYDDATEILEFMLKHAD